jgi:hypothetical protein
MKPIQQAASLIFSLVMLSSVPTGAQTQPQTPPEPPTKLEALMAKTGAVIVRGSSTIGSVTGRNGASISVESKEFLDASTGKREYGIVIDVKKGGDVASESFSYIDYDEIDSLIKGMDYISKLQNSITKLDNFQANYQTNGAFKITRFSSGGQTTAAVASGEITEVNVFLSLSKLDDLRGLIMNAKNKLDAIK